ncbi:M20 family metallopeptidase [Sinomonas sp. JGH33]|uniref:M20 family metallopeptidase n=1 Tax=Sinomonas terricola TaxID=3110330 RepID=A0ABU5TCB9_9MICC|nr:M20 family metallopeptidase [Sinomonas sp. JGH33]MEA5457321.1 M20 family metallopeptidase [Sinomonas sp. JGH33]
MNPVTVPLATPAAPSASSALEEAHGILPDIRELRRLLHRFPELGTHLPRTQAEVLRRLERLEGLEITPGAKLTSVTAVLRGQAPLPERTRRPVVLLRADMDALPITEETGLDFASEVDGVMHACGHDLHTAALYGAARVLHARRHELVADVVFMFQPAEEAYVGVKWMIEEGVLDAAGRRADAAFGLHVQSSQLAKGVFSSRPGALMAGCDELLVRVRGVGGHGSTPFLAKDPVPVAAEMVVAFQTLVTRGYDPFDPVIVTVGRIQAGTAGNIIPECADFNATVRMFSPHHRERLVGDLERLCRGIAHAHGMSVELAWAEPYPVTMADPVENAYAAAVVREILDDSAFIDLEHPHTGSEDFAWVLQEVPGTFLSLGASASSDPATAPSLHSPHATFDESVLPRAVACLAELALRRDPVPQ